MNLMEEISRKSSGSSGSGSGSKVNKAQRAADSDSSEEDQQLYQDSRLGDRHDRKEGGGYEKI